MKTLIRFEFRKIFARRITRAALLALLVLSVLFNSSSYRNMHAFDGVSKEGSGGAAVEIDKEVARKYQGILTDETVQRIFADMGIRYDLHGLNAAYLRQNATQSAAFARFADKDGHWNGLTVSDVFGEEEIRIGYTYGWLQTSQDLIRVLIVLSLVLIVMISPVFSVEYGGVDNLILTARYGKTVCATAKAIASCLAALAVTAVILLISLVTALVAYGSDGLRCSILFAPMEFTEVYIPFNITCGTLMGYQVLLAFTSAVGITGITLVLSALCKNPTVALVAAAALHMLPVMIPVSEANPLFRYLALLPLYQLQFISLMSVERISGDLLYAIWALPVALALLGIGFFASGKIFREHQVT